MFERGRHFFLPGVSPNCCAGGIQEDFLPPPKRSHSTVRTVYTAYSMLNSTAPPSPLRRRHFCLGNLTGLWSVGRRGLHGANQRTADSPSWRNFKFIATDERLSVRVCMCVYVCVCVCDGCVCVCVCEGACAGAVVERVIMHFFFWSKKDILDGWSIKRREDFSEMCSHAVPCATTALCCIYIYIYNT